MEERNLRLTLHDGRTLSYNTFGDPSGFPIMYFHGFMSAGNDWRLLGDHVNLDALGAWVIAADRPGIGASTYRPGRHMGDWADDVLALADELSVDRFALLGVSGGGPYALACAHRIPERLTRVSVVSCMGPATAPGVRDGMSMTLPNMGRVARWVTLQLTRLMLDRQPDRFLEQALPRMAEPDRAALANDRTRKAFLDGVRRSFQGGVRGVFHEASLYAAPWGFDLADVAVPVRLWHGEEDAMVPITAARFVAEAVPRCNATWLPGEGHLSWAEAHAEDIVRALTFVGVKEVISTVSR